MDKDMMRALEADAAMLEAMGADEQPLAFVSPGAGMRLTNAAKGLWEVFDGDKVVRRGLTLEQADALVFEIQSNHAMPSTSDLIP